MFHKVFKPRGQIFCFCYQLCLCEKYNKYFNFNANNCRNYASKKTQGRKKKQKAIEDEREILVTQSKYKNHVWTDSLETNNVYIGSKNAAREVAKCICEDTKDTFIFESNPGPGVLTEALLEMGVPNLRVFEGKEDFLPTLETLSKKFPGHLDIVAKDIMVQDNKSDENADTQSYFNGVPTLSWTDGIPCKFFGIISNPASINFMRYLFARLSTMTSFFSYGRFRFFFLLSDLEFEYLVAKPKENFAQYRETTIFYHLYFETEYLKKFPLEMFLPLSTKIPGRKAQRYLHLVKITPKKDLMTLVVEKDQLPHFYFFVHHLLTRRRRYVMSSLEQWILGCSPQLIEVGIQGVTKFGDLNPIQILQLFHKFSSLPDYQQSSFHIAVKTFYEHKTTLHDE